MNYSVGPGQGVQNILDLPWQKITAGDEVRIYPRPNGAPYFERLSISASGVIVWGVPDAFGNRPVIDGTGAKSRTDVNFGAWLDDAGTCLIMGPNKAKVSNVLIRGLTFRNARYRDSYINSAGATVPYGALTKEVFGAYLFNADGCRIQDCEFEQCDGGIFVNGNVSNGSTCAGLQVIGNWFHDNGVVGSSQLHHSYCEAVGTAATPVIYEWNRYDDLMPGALGGSLKDRSSGTIARYNQFLGGARLIDLVHSEDGAPVICRQPSYPNASVYGNLFISREGAVPVHFGGDEYTQVDNYRDGTLSFYQNTVLLYADWRAPFFDLPTNAQRVEAWDNLFAVLPVTAGASPVPILLVSGNGSSGDGTVRGNVRIRESLLPVGFVPSYGWSSTAPGNIAPLMGTVTTSGLISEIPSFVDPAGGNLRLLPSSAAFGKVSGTISNPETVMFEPIPARENPYWAGYAATAVIKAGSNLGCYQT